MPKSPSKPSRKAKLRQSPKASNRSRPQDVLEMSFDNVRIVHETMTELWKVLHELLKKQTKPWQVAMRKTERITGDYLDPDWRRDAEARLNRKQARAARRRQPASSAQQSHGEET